MDTDSSIPDEHKMYLAARAVEVMTITKVIEREVDEQLKDQPVSDSVKNWTKAIVNNVCHAYDSVLGTGLLEADEELTQLADKIVKEQLNKVKEKKK